MWFLLAKKKYQFTFGVKRTYFSVANKALGFGEQIGERQEYEEGHVREQEYKVP